VAKRAKSKESDLGKAFIKSSSKELEHTIQFNTTQKGTSEGEILWSIYSWVMAFVYGDLGRSKCRPSPVLSLKYMPLLV
jgi:hypothetical protein